MTNDTLQIPGLNHVPQEWMEELSRAAQWAAAGFGGPEESGALRCGVIQGNPTSRWLIALSSVLFEGTTRLHPYTSVIYATDQRWRGHVQALNEESLRGGTAADEGPEFRIDSYQTVQLWLRGQGSSSAKGDTRAVLFVLEVDSTYSAAFAAALLAIMAWSRWAASRKSAPRKVAVILVSVGAMHATVQRVLDEALPGDVMAFELARLHDGRERVKQFRLDTSKTCEVLCRIAREASDAERHLVLLFGTPMPYRALLTLDEVGYLKLNKENSSSAESRFASKDARMLIMRLPWGFHAPFPIRGFTHLHLICTADAEIVKSHDFQTGQVVDIYRDAAIADLKEQFSWAFRADCPRENVSVYRQVNEPFLRPERRCLFNDRQMEGMLAEVAYLGTWLGGIGGKAFLPLVQPNFMTAYDSMRRMANLDILKVDFENMGMTESLEKSLRGPFHALLRLFDYDPRLALFVCFPTRSAAVRAIKIQVAALQLVGIVSLFPALEFGRDHGVVKEEIAALCSGYTKSIATTGTTWALLALWKNAMRSHLDLLAGNAGDSQLVPGKVTISWEAASRMLAWEDEIREVLKSHPIEDLDLLPSSDEPDTIENWEVNELREHVLHCYNSQLAAAILPDNGGADDADEEHPVPVRYRDLASRSIFGVEDGVEGLVDFQMLKHKDSNMKVPIGAYMNLIRTDRRSHTDLRDWIWIPRSTWASWAPGRAAASTSTQEPGSLVQILGRTAPVENNADGD